MKTWGHPGSGEGRVQHGNSLKFDSQGIGVGHVGVIRDSGEGSNFGADRPSANMASMPRPVTYNEQLARQIIEAVAAGDSVTVACRRASVPRTTFSTWVAAGRGQLADRLSRAKARTKRAPTATWAAAAIAAPAAHDRFVAWLAANRDQLAARREQTKSTGEAAERPARPENPETPQITATYTANRTALRLIAAALEAVAAELRRTT